MRTKRIEAARSVAGRLFAAEQAIDIAATRVAELSAIMPIARLDANLSALVGQDAFTASSKALKLMARARGQLVMTHERLKNASDLIGLESVAFGDAIKPNKGISSDAPNGHLRIAS